MKCFWQNNVPSSRLTVAYISDAVSPLSCLPTGCGISGKLLWLFCVDALFRKRLYNKNMSDTTADVYLLASSSDLVVAVKY